MTFLELCQKCCEKSGVIQGTLPASVAGQAGILLKIVNNVAEAWRRIQLEQSCWLWMRKEWSHALVIDTVRYTATNFAISDFGRWLTNAPMSAYQSITIYDPSIGVSDEGPLLEISWEQFRMLYLRGTQTAERPRHVSFDPQSKICFGPKPDKAYVVSGEYWTAIEALTTDSQVPSLPVDYHDIIWNRALMLLNEDEEATFLLGVSREEYHRLMSMLVVRKLPPMKTAFRPPPIA